MATAADLLAAHYKRTNARVLTVVEELDDDQLRRFAAPGAHPVAFNLWHVARWSDHLAVSIPRMTTALADRLGHGRQIWEAEGLAGAWGFPAEAIGDQLLEPNAPERAANPTSTATVGDAAPAIWSTTTATSAGSSACAGCWACAAPPPG